MPRPGLKTIALWIRIVRHAVILSAPEGQLSLLTQIQVT